MTPELKAKWIAALRSGEYRQGQFRLVRQVSEDELYHCCLGVLCEVTGYSRLQNPKIACLFNYVMPTGETISTMLPKSMLSREIQITLSQMNDRESKNFVEIADYIEENIP